MARSTAGIDPDVYNLDHMKRNIYLIGLLAGAAISCSVSETDVADSDSPEIFYALMENADAQDTRVYATPELYLRWHADDRISIFNRNTGNQEYRFTGETGDNAGGFSRVQGGSSETGTALENIYAIYPFQASTRISETGVIGVTLPAEQPYAENTFGPGANTMASATTDNLLIFKNVGGYLMLKLYGDDVTVSTISLKGNDGERLAGEATVTIPVDGVPSVTLSETAGQEILLVCDTPVGIGTSAETATAFWLVVPPLTFSQGFTVTVTDPAGRIFTKSTTKPFEITRSKLARMAALQTIPTAPPAESITLNKTATQLVPGSTVTLVAVVTPAGCEDPVVWTTANPSIATVNNGEVTGVALGTTVITATVGSLSATCTVTVTTNTVGDWEDGDHSSGNI